MFEKAFNAIRHVVSVFVILALAVPTLRAEDEGSDRDVSWTLLLALGLFT
jgi:hypothetical protein